MALRSIRARAFTLVEMLTVIGILAILLAIIIPAINKARNAARRTDTAGQLKEICGALGVPFIYKSSFDKANRTSASSFRAVSNCESSCSQISAR